MGGEATWCTGVRIMGIDYHPLFVYRDLADSGRSSFFRPAFSYNPRSANNDLPHPSFSLTYPGVPTESAPQEGRSLDIATSTSRSSE
jgi:hypothetical protein